MSAGPIPALDIRRHAASQPAAVAVRDGAGEHSWADLDGAADAAAAGMVAWGIGLGDRVALLVEPSAEAIACLVGVARAGAVAVPLGTRLTRREVGLALAETAPAMLVRDPGRAATADGHGVPARTPAEIAERATAASAATAGRAPAAGSSTGDGHAAAGSRPAVPSRPGAHAVAILTSGTSGRPKAALLSHAALAASARAWTSALPPATGWLLCLGLDHVAGLGVAWRAIGAGVPLTIVAPFDPAAVLAALTDAPGPPSHLSLVPVQLARLLDVAAASARGAVPPGRRGGVPPGLRAVALGGAPIPADLVARALAGGWPVIPTYGLTEGGSGVTALAADEAALHPGSAGRPLPGVRVRVSATGADGVGAIEVRTPAVFGGYLGRPAETAAAFTADGWLRTGDLGRLDGDGRLSVVDRREDLIVCGGENVYPAEVEEVLVAQPAIIEAGVVARPDPTWGTVPVAGLVLRPDVADPGDESFRTWCRERLSPPKVPAVFARLEALPRTGSGKLRRRALRDRLVPAVVLLHATLSTGRQLGALARELAAPGDLRVLAPDRRGSGTRRLDDPRPVSIDEHLADLAALLDAEGIERAILVGHSFGGALAIEAAARLPDRVAGVVAYEPPYGPLAEPDVRVAFADLARATAESFAAGGPGAAAAVFVDGVGGPGSWDALPDRTRAFLVREGAGALADAGLTGLRPEGLAAISCPVTILLGTASEPFYRPIAAALAARVRGARRVDLAGLRHTAPITDPVAIAAAVREVMAEAGLLPLAAARRGTRQGPGAAPPASPDVPGEEHA
ncbi:MAG: alpha/beta fold hydrolase [Chloroflexi bacterium]|jgi:O-succinylbenzoic acid--CoA ligase|nr:alpha/beta fold hydrolase [Chloroflexota bacterium]